MRWWAAALAVVVTVAFGGAARAQAAADNMTRAKAYFAAGVDAYDQGRYEVALREFQHAHALSHSPALYFNMAACEEHMDHYQAAALLLRQYLIEKPEADDKTNVELRIKSLEERDDRLHKMVESPPPPMKSNDVMATAPAATTKPKSHLKYTWVMLGATAAVGVAAIGVGAYTVAHHGDLKNGCGNTVDGCSASQVSGLKSTAVATDVLIGVTAAAAVATVVFAVVESRRGRASAHAALGSSPPEPARVAWTGTGLVF
jgi:tetratricopeptide (TPR) repeat protein